MDARLKITESIVRAALAGASEVELAAGACEQLTAAGVALVRLSIATNMLDPTHDARLVRWVRGEGPVEELVMRTDESAPSETWTSSPFFHLVESGLPLMRRRLDASYRRGEFALLDSFQDAGVTDYLVYRERLGKDMLLGEGEGLVASWTTDAPGGFTDAQVDMLTMVMPVLTLAFMMRTTNRAARTLIATYLGEHASARVLAGNIVRGRAQTIRAIVWFSDLQGFTRISDSVTPEVLLAMLNDYAEAQVEEIERHHGHVLKFMGDGILAIFPDEDTTRACRHALGAAAHLRRRIAALNERRQAAGLPVTDTHLALHVGELLYGNLGSPRRLDFTVLGSAVNVAERIEALCQSLDQKVIVSWAFAEAAGAARSALVSLGRYAMKGVAHPQELFTLDPIGELGELSEPGEPAASVDHAVPMRR